MAIFTKPLSTNTRRWADLDLDFAKHPVTKDVVLKRDVEAVKRSIRNLILTNQYERPFQPNIDGGVTRLLFELSTPHTKHNIESAIRNCISNYEPRAEITKIIIDPQVDRNGYAVSVEFRVVNQTIPATVILFLERLR